MNKSTRLKSSDYDRCAYLFAKKKDLVKIFNLFLLSIFAVVLLSGVGSSTECTSTLGSNGCTVSQNLQLVPGTYYYNGSTNNGAIIINSSNLILDGNGSNLIYSSN